MARSTYHRPANAAKQADNRERLAVDPDTLCGVTVTSAQRWDSSRLKGRRARWDLTGGDD